MDGAELIAAERRRQVEAEGWTPEHDDQHILGDLGAAAVSYTTYAVGQTRRSAALRSLGHHEGDEFVRTEADEFARTVKPQVLESWVWEPSAFKPDDDPVRNLVRAGALIAAEIDRLQRAAMARAVEGGGKR